MAVCAGSGRNGFFGWVKGLNLANAEDDLAQDRTPHVQKELEIGFPLRIDASSLQRESGDGLDLRHGCGISGREIMSTEVS